MQLSVSVSLTWFGGFSISSAQGSLKHIFLSFFFYSIYVLQASYACPLPTETSLNSSADDLGPACRLFPDTVSSSVSLTALLHTLYSSPIEQPPAP